jgi:DNA polymerase-3 subunit beta
MKVKFNTEELKKRLSQLGSVVAKKATVPVFGFVRLFTTPITGEGLLPKYQVSMIGVDIDAALTVTLIKAEATEDIDVLLPFDKLIDVVNNISAQEITLEPKEGKVIIAATKFKGTLETHPVENWPTALERPENPTATIALPGFKDQIDLIEFAVPANDGKFVVSVAKLDSTKDELALVSTDGFRLAIAKSQQNAGIFSLQLPKPALELIKKLEGTQLTISEAEAGFYFETELEILTISRSHGEFPPYQEILPKSHKTQIVVSKKPLLEALKRLKIFGDKEKPTVMFTVTAGSNVLHLEAVNPNASAGGDVFRNVAEDEIDLTANNGEAQQFPLNPAYMLPFLENAFGSGDGSIVVNINDGTKLVDFVANDGRYRYLQMPVNTEAKA